MAKYSIVAMQTFTHECMKSGKSAESAAFGWNGKKFSLRKSDLEDNYFTTVIVDNNCEKSSDLSVTIKTMIPESLPLAYIESKHHKDVEVKLGEVCFA